MARKDEQTVHCWRERHRKLTIYFASTEKGAAMVGISLSEPEDCVGYFRENLPETRLVKDRAMNAVLIHAVEAALENREFPKRIPLDVTSTSFQMEVWRALARIPYGATKTYSEVARMVGRPLAARAVGQAMGQNPLPLFFP